MTIQELNQELGNIDVFLLDQILKGRFEQAGRILDAGCGEGRNLTYFISNGYDVWGIDSNPTALQMLRMIGRSLHTNFDREKFIEADITEIPFPPRSFDAIICTAVLHFLPSEEAFFTALDEMMKVLRKGGFLLISMISNIHNRDSTVSTEEHPQSDRLFLTETLYTTLLLRYKLQEIEPVKTVVAGNAQATTYMILKKES